MRGRLLITLLTLAVLMPGLRAQDMERRTIQRTMDIAWHERQLQLSATFTEVFTPRLRRRLSSGFTSRLLVEALVKDRRRHTPLARALFQCTILYDLWEERYFVRLQQPGQRRDMALGSLTEVVQTCGKVERLELQPLLAIPERVEVEAELRVTVNPTSPELQRKVRQYLANPGGGASALGSPRSFFGSFSRIFVDEQEIKADLVYRYRCPALRLEHRPSGG